MRVDVDRKRQSAVDVLEPHVAVHESAMLFESDSG